MSLGEVIFFADLSISKEESSPVKVEVHPTLAAVMSEVEPGAQKDLYSPFLVGGFVMSFHSPLARDTPKLSCDDFTCTLATRY